MKNIYISKARQVGERHLMSMDVDKKIFDIENRIRIENRNHKIESIINNTNYFEAKRERDSEWVDLMKDSPIALMSYYVIDQGSTQSNMETIDYISSFFLNSEQ